MLAWSSLSEDKVLASVIFFSMSVMCEISEVEWYVNMLEVQTLSLRTDRPNKTHWHIASGASMCFG